MVCFVSNQSNEIYPTGGFTAQASKILTHPIQVPFFSATTPSFFFGTEVTIHFYFFKKKKYFELIFFNNIKIKNIS